MWLIFGWLLLVGHLLGIIEKFYDRIWYGPVIHFIGGLFLASLTGSLFFSFLLAVLWEVFEWSFDRLCPQYSDKVCWYSRSWDGALRDVFFTTLGALTFLNV